MLFRWFLRKHGWLAWPVLRWGAVVACVVVVGAVVTLRQQQGSRQIASTIAERKPGVESSVCAGHSAGEECGGQECCRRWTDREPADGKNREAGWELCRGGPGSGRNGRRPGWFAMSWCRDEPRLRNHKTPRPAKGIDGHRKHRCAGRRFEYGNHSTGVDEPPPRWTLSSDGTLQRSRDSGRTWQTIPVSSNTIFRALAANGLNIWVGGAAGALFHSSDAGQHWTQVRPVVNGEALAGDIIGVEFTDTLHGKLTTSTEEIWITADAGQTWQK